MVKEYNYWTMASDSGTYEYMVERIPTYFNDFIPRGLFHDLMDEFNPNEDFDNLSGHTLLQIYHEMDDWTWSIQKFRENWQASYPSVHNENPFNEYNIDLP